MTQEMKGAGLGEGIKAVMAQAIRRRRSAKRLADALYEEYGVEGEEGGAYDGRTVSTWARQTTKTMPPALALLAAAALTNQSLDQLIHRESIEDRLLRLEDASRRQGELLGRIEEVLRRLAPGLGGAST